MYIQNSFNVSFFSRKESYWKGDEAINSIYINGRSILDRPLILNELITWSKKDKKIDIFNVDFDKAFYSLNWGFLDSVMEQMNFGSCWRN